MPEDTSPAAGDRTAWGFGLATITDDGAVLDTWFPTPALGARPADATPPAALSTLVGKHPERRVHRDLVTVEIDLDAAPAEPSDAYLRLHLLSHCLVPPHGLNLDGIFGVLTNVVWTNRGPCAVDGFEEVRAALLADGPVEVLGIDKFPRMTDYVVPAGVRIGDASRVRLGAHLATGPSGERLAAFVRREAPWIDLGHTLDGGEEPIAAARLATVHVICGP